jgi:hypothetical protein
MRKFLLGPSMVAPNHLRVILLTHSAWNQGMSGTYDLFFHWVAALDRPLSNTSLLTLPS